MLLILLDRKRKHMSNTLCRLLVAQAHVEAERPAPQYIFCNSYYY